MDPIVKLAEALYVTYDFDEMRSKFHTSREILKADFFLSGYDSEFSEYFRRAIVDNAIYCHSSFTVSWINGILDLPADNTEWISNHIQRLSNVTLAEGNKSVTIERTTNPNAINNAFTLKREVYERFKSLSHSIESTEKFLSEQQSKQ